MSTSQEILEFVFFTATKQCLEDLAPFKALLDATKERSPDGLVEQYWGLTQEKPQKVCWVLHWATQERRDAYPTGAFYASELKALARDEVDTTCMSFNRTPLPCLNSPFTEFTLIKLAEEVKLEDAKVQFDTVMGLLHNPERRPWGMRENAWGFAGTPHGLRAIYIGGWESVEAHLDVGRGDADEAFLESVSEVMVTFEETMIYHAPLSRHS